MSCLKYWKSHYDTVSIAGHWWMKAYNSPSFVFLSVHRILFFSCLLGFGPSFILLFSPESTFKPELGSYPKASKLFFKLEWPPTLTWFLFNRFSTEVYTFRYAWINFLILPHFKTSLHCQITVTYTCFWRCGKHKSNRAWAFLSNET